jgi:hypothetical protein
MKDNMPMRLAATATVALTALSLPAFADLLEFGASVRCDASMQRFELSSTVQHNEQFTVVASSLSKLRPLGYGSTHLQCKVGPTQVVVTVKITPPSNGECGGVGYVAVTQFDVGSYRLPIEAGQQQFSWRCREQTIPILFSVRRGADRTLIDRCTADNWTWERGYNNVKCTTESLIDSEQK